MRVRGMVRGRSGFKLGLGLGRSALLPAWYGGGGAPFALDVRPLLPGLLPARNAWGGGRLSRGGEGRGKHRSGVEHQLLLLPLLLPRDYVLLPLETRVHVQPLAPAVELG